ncbi:EAL domain-containing protein [Gracilinema caldarium]|uniref:Diguanylate cyclase/phosphodiesterase with PAS/PAC sensor(S) n=1 Tax=Gracilinema caldarium (strain ATCC 51460 / DSM 7334 / H1) TaxID=744872 RepID=F8F405_GRAC1|nr:EAL domain-containing protein [Gracilinema caldarium]AEJ20024.1 diguanylate cyclase/phosphodiesterase with PAS/PAC sensor(s) [Gracilinema caldarium DSM 7334]
MHKVHSQGIIHATRTLFLSTFGLTLLLFILAIVSTGQFFRLEKKAAQQAKERVLTILEYQFDQIASITADYSQWDDTWNFMNGSNPEFSSINFTDESIQNLGFNFVGIYTLKGKLYFSFFADQARPLAIPDELPTPLQKDCHGLLIIDESPYLVAIKTIVKSNLSGPPAGYFVFGKILDTELEAVISKLSGTKVNLYKAENSDVVPQITFSSTAITIIASIPVLLSDKPLLASITISRDLFWNGFRSLTLFFILALLLSSVIFVNYGSSRRLLVFEKNTAAFLEQEIQERTESLRAANTILLNYKKILDNTSEGILITDLHGRILETNPAIYEMTGFSEEELIGQYPSLFASGMHPPEYYRALWNAIIDHGKWEGEIWNRKKDGTLLPFWLSINTLKNLEGKPCKYVAFYIDITQLKQTQEKLNNLAFYDSLTGLPNRALFMDRLDQVLSRAQRDKNRFALLYMDLDHFKDVNDGFGHQAGDELLILTAHRIKSQVREADTVCRLGGDEFVIILEEVHKSIDTALVAKKIISALREPFFIKDREIYIGSSIGIALYPYDGATIQELVKNADAAMYDAKEQGRGQYRFASGASGISSRQRIEVETTIRKAIDENRLVLYYQPQVSSGSAEAGKFNGIIGAEALIRIKTVNDEIIPPSQFIDVAEETGLIIPLGGWALIQACKDAKEWKQAGKPIQVSVNVSQRQFERGHIIKQTEEALRVSDLDPQLLKLEVTESLFIRDAQRVSDIMNDLKKLGVCFAIDDFGTGYSSLRYLDALPIDSLKIDKSFVDHLQNDVPPFSADRLDKSIQQNGTIALAVVSMARSFGLVSVAEGVETIEQLEALKRRGCDVIQGYLISKPLPSDLFRDFLFHEYKQFQTDVIEHSEKDDEEAIEELQSI